MKSYLVIGSILLVFTALFLWAWPNRDLQRVLIGCLMLAYFVWGVVTHTKSNVLTLHLVLEYLGVSLLAGILLVLVTI
jgi:predicted lysophospholipase L1 biosynthesis ABC-type transport system permease subunit